jgi:hypothetical protein
MPMALDSDLRADDPDTLPQKRREWAKACNRAYSKAYRERHPEPRQPGHRWVDEEDIDAYIARCKAAGPRFAPTPAGRRKPGRPRKPKSEASAGA